MSNKLQQNGFVLVSVLLITSISTFFAFSAIAESRLQERMAGNQVKEVNARAKAEKGLLSVVQEIEARDQNEESLEDIISAINTGSSIPGEYALNIEMGATDELLNVKSAGVNNDAIAYLNAEVFFKSSNLNLGGGIIACENINLAEGARIDSYDSREGGYPGLEEANNSANVVTILGDVDMAGGGAVKGSITANGNITQVGSAVFGGNLVANGDISVEQARVKGNISSNQNTTIKGGIVGTASDHTSGNISALGDVHLIDSPRSANHGEHKGSIDANGEVTNNDPGGYDPDDFFAVSDSPSASEAIMMDNKCNEKDIVNAIPDTATAPISTNMNAGMNGDNSQRSFVFNESTAQVFNDEGYEGDDTYKQITPTLLDSSLWESEGEKSVYVFDDFHLSNTKITVDGDVVIIVNGDLTTAGGDSGFVFAVDDHSNVDTESSLTLIVKGQTHIGSDTVVFPSATIDAQNPRIPLTLYSSFASTGDNVGANAVYLNGASNMYAKVYAPLGNVEYAASGSMMGSLEGKNVNVSGDGNIHYDEALVLFDENSEPDRGLPSFYSLYYHYPD